MSRARWAKWRRTAAYIYRDFVPLVAVVMAGIGLLSFDSVLKEQKEGRRVALRIVCAVSASNAEAGRKLLLFSAAREGDVLIGKPGDPDFRIKSGELSRFLERHGMSGPQERIERSRAAATAYAIDSAQAVRREAERAGVTADIVRPDGGLDCDRLQAAAKAGEAK